MPLAPGTVEEVVNDFLAQPEGLYTYEDLLEATGAENLQDLATETGREPSDIFYHLKTDAPTFGDFEDFGDGDGPQVKYDDISSFLGDAPTAADLKASLAQFTSVNLPQGQFQYEGELHKFLVALLHKASQDKVANIGIAWPQVGGPPTCKWNRDQWQVDVELRLRGREDARTETKKRETALQLQNTEQKRLRDGTRPAASANFAKLRTASWYLTWTTMDEYMTHEVLLSLLKTQSALKTKVETWIGTVSNARAVEDFVDNPTQRNMHKITGPLWRTVVKGCRSQEEEQSWSENEFSWPDVIAEAFGWSSDTIVVPVFTRRDVWKIDRRTLVQSKLSLRTSTRKCKKEASQRVVPTVDSVTFKMEPSLQDFGTLQGSSYGAKILGVPFGGKSKFESIKGSEYDTRDMGGDPQFAVVKQTFKDLDADYLVSSGTSLRKLDDTETFKLQTVFEKAGDGVRSYEFKQERTVVNIELSSGAGQLPQFVAFDGVVGVVVRDAQMDNEAKRLAFRCAVDMERQTQESLRCAQTEDKLGATKYNEKCARQAPDFEPDDFLDELMDQGEA